MYSYDHLLEVYQTFKRIVPALRKRKKSFSINYSDRVIYFRNGAQKQHVTFRCGTIFIAGVWSESVRLWVFFPRYAGWFKVSRLPWLESMTRAFMGLHFCYARSDVASFGAIIFPASLMMVKYFGLSDY